jgi:hypothetical protein
VRATHSGTPRTGARPRTVLPGATSGSASGPAPGAAPSPTATNGFSGSRFE